MSDELAEARTKALTLLARREHSRAELGAKLKGRAVASEHIEAVLDGLVAEGLLSDGRFAAEYARSRAARGSGPLRIRGELRERGVADAHVAQALDERDPAWLEVARAQREKRFGAPPPSAYAERARQARFLRYRGFTPDQVAATVGWSNDETPE
jgi:regulatory protein